MWTHEHHTTRHWPNPLPCVFSCVLCVVRCSLRVVVAAQLEIPAWRKHFDVVVACEGGDDDEDVDVPLISVKFR